jgi:hypothetical protein
MAKESKAQQQTVERVMHEFKHGELKSGNGRKVKNPKQAIAIGLSEAGASNRQSPAENRKRKAATTRREAKGETARDRDQTRAALYDKAKKQNVPGRSKMNKAELARAVG